MILHFLLRNGKFGKTRKSRFRHKQASLFNEWSFATDDHPPFVGYNQSEIKKEIEKECTCNCFWWGLFLSVLVTFGGGTMLALLWLFFEWLFKFFAASSSDYDENKEDKPFDIDDDLSADDEMYIYETFINK